MLQRGEKIELLVDKTDALSQTAFKFKKQAKQVKNVMWWKNVKILCIIGFILAVVIFFIVGSICGFDFACASSSSSGTGSGSGASDSVARRVLRGAEIVYEAAFPRGPSPEDGLGAGNGDWSG